MLFAALQALAADRATVADHASPARPLQAELIAPLDLSRVHAGSSVLVRVDVDWAESGCTLRVGSIVPGHVVDLQRRSKASRDSLVRLAFDATACNTHGETSFPFTLVALVVGTRSPTGQSGVSEAPPLADAIGNAIGGASGIRSAQSASAINSGFPVPAPSFPATIRPGQVVGLRKTTLLLDRNGAGASAIVGVGHDLRLEQGTSLILTHDLPRTVNVAESNQPAEHVANTSSSRNANTGTGADGREFVPANVSKPGTPVISASPPPLLPDPPDETDICAGACNVVGETGVAPDALDTTAVATLALKKLGYSPRANRELRSFDDETTLTYLDANNLLCTFDPHLLRERAGGEEEAVRSVRAVLIDPETHSIKRVLELRVRGDRQYLWKLPQGRVLVHMGKQLKIFDTHLQPIRSIPFEGKVAWIVSSPTGDHLAVGTIRERHSEAVHRDLEAVLSGEPEEDVDVHLLDKDLAVVVTSLQSSKLPSPVLSDAGELRLRGDGHTHWKITEYRWDRSEHPVATTRSTCRPVLSTPQDNMIFAVGCTASGGRWYRMLRSDGRPLLKGESPSDEIQQSAQAASGGSFAVRTVKAVRSMDYGQPFKKADLARQRIAIYRTLDGANVATVATSDFALSQTGFALSPSAEEVAVLGNSSIFFYRIPPHRN